MKSLTLALCVIAILGSAASTFFYFQVGNSKELLKQDAVKAQARATELQSKLDDSTTQGDVLQKRLAELDSDLGEAKSKATAADSRSTQLTRDLAQLKNQLTAKTDAEQALNGEIAQLKREIAQAKLGASGTSSEEIDAYKASIASLQAKVTELVDRAESAMLTPVPFSRRVNSASRARRLPHGGRALAANAPSNAAEVA